MPVAKRTASKPKAPAKPKVYTDSQLYTGRAVTVKRGLLGTITVGKVSNGGQCDANQFAFSGPNGEEDCVARSSIVSLGK